MDTKINLEEFTLISNEVENNCTVKESTRIMETQRSDTLKDKLIENHKRLGLDESIKLNCKNSKFRKYRYKVNI